MVTNVASAAAQMAPAFVTGLDLTLPENADEPVFSFELLVVTPVATMKKFGQYLSRRIPNSASIAV